MTAAPVSTPFCWAHCSHRWSVTLVSCSTVVRLMTASRSLQLSHSIRVSHPPSSPPPGDRPRASGSGPPGPRAAGCESPPRPPSRTPARAGRTPRAAGRRSRGPGSPTARRPARGSGRARGRAPPRSVAAPHPRAPPAGASYGRRAPPARALPPPGSAPRGRASPRSGAASSRSRAPRIPARDDGTETRNPTSDSAVPRWCPPPSRRSASRRATRRPRWTGPARRADGATCSCRRPRHPRWLRTRRDGPRAPPRAGPRAAGHRRPRIPCGGRAPRAMPSFVPDRGHGIEPRRLERGVQGRERGYHEARDHHEDHVDRLRMNREMVDEVDRGDDRNQVPTVDLSDEQEAKKPDEDGTGEPDQDPLGEEDAPDRRLPETHREQDADLPRLVTHHHGEGADDVEGGHDADQEHDERHRELLELERREQRRVL